MHFPKFPTSSTQSPDPIVQQDSPEAIKAESLKRAAFQIVGVALATLGLIFGSLCCSTMKGLMIVYVCVGFGLLSYTYPEALLNAFRNLINSKESDNNKKT